MQYRLLDLLCCPGCRGDLVLEEFERGEREPPSASSTRRCQDRCAYWEAKLGQEYDCRSCGKIEVAEGLIGCTKCGKKYPVIKGVPRFLPDELQQEVIERYPEFFVRYESKIAPSLTLTQQDRIGKLKAQTMSSFGYEWNEFADYDAQNFQELIYPIQPEYFSNKLGLDCGCGAGRHTQQAVAYGAEMVAMDLSWAVDASYKKNFSTARAMVVQCDVFNLPFRQNRFDLIYSLGVLHHTTNPPRSFDCLVPLLKPGGGIMVWIYSSTRKFVLLALKLARILTLRLPNLTVKWLSFLAACVDYGLFVWPYKVLRRIPGLGEILEAITPPRVKGYAKYDFHVSYTDWFDRLSYPCVNYYSGDQVREWYERNGLIDLKISATGPFAWRGFGIKPVAK